LGKYQLLFGLEQSARAHLNSELNYPITKLPNYSITNLLNFFMSRVLAAAFAKLLELKPTRCGLLVLGG
jgi:hypothetical protein